jgi:hypothetical protein
MKILLSLIVLMSFSAFADPMDVICSIRHARKLIPKVEKHSEYDKNRHCSVSCMLAIRCNVSEVMFLGVLKEVKDFFGDGNPEKKDLIADKYGIELATSQRARKDLECFEQCDLQYR